MDWFITIIILLPAIVFAVSGSAWLVDYAFVIVAFNRGLRRIVDYYINHAFTPLSPISLTPLVICVLLLVPFMLRFNTLLPRVRMIFWLFLAAFVHAFFVGFIQNRFAAVFQLTEYLAPIGIMGYAATANVEPGIADRWIRSAGWTAVGVAAYGWFQYFNPPAWDGFWMQQVGFIGYLGIPEPTKIIVFSTMAERGPCAAYLAAAAIPMIVAARWRNWTGWFSIAFILSVIPLTYVRTTLIGVALVLLIHPLVNKGRGFVAIFLCVVLLVVGVKYGADKLPTSEALLARYQTIGNMPADSSFQGRLNIAAYGFDIVKSHPLGFGFGATGMAGRVNTGGVEASSRFTDNGYISLLLDYGWVGGICFFMALWYIWKEIMQRFNTGSRDEFITLSRSWFLAMLVLQYVANVYVGISLFWVFIGVALSSSYDPLIRRLLDERLEEIARLRLAPEAEAPHPVEDQASRLLTSDL